MKDILRDVLRGTVETGEDAYVVDSNGVVVLHYSREEDFQQESVGTDIGQLVDPNTGQPVSGRLASIVFRLSSRVPVFGSRIPEGVPQNSARPWIIGYGGNEYDVRRSAPDRTIGVVMCICGVWRA